MAVRVAIGVQLLLPVLLLLSLMESESIAGQTPSATIFTTTLMTLRDSWIDGHFSRSRSTTGGEVLMASAESSSLSMVELLGPGDRGPSVAELADMLADVIMNQFNTCLNVILYDKSSLRFLSLVESLLNKEQLEYNRMVWDLQTFLDTRPPNVLLQPKSTPETNLQNVSSTSLCVGVVILAELDVASQAVPRIQRSSWFPGSDKLFLLISSAQTSSFSIEDHPILGKSANVVISTWRQSISHEGDEDITAEGGDVPGDFVHNLHTVCPHCNDGKALVSLADTWRTGFGLNKETNLYPDVFLNFQGYKMQVVTLEYMPFSCYERVETNPGSEQMKAKNSAMTTLGYEVKLRDCVDTRLLNAISNSLNFTYTVKEPADMQWGYRLDNGTHTGVIGSVQHGFADFSLNVAVLAAREEVIDYTVGYFNDPLTFSTTRPRPLNQSLALLRPFHWKVWIILLIVLSISGPSYYLSYFTAGIGKETNKISFSDAAFGIFGAMFNQSIRWPQGTVPRLVGASWIIFSFVTLTSYVAMLIASFTLPTLSPTLNTLEELVTSDFSWGIQDLGAADYQMLKTSTVPLYKEVFKGLEFCPSLNECLVKARDHNFAFITWRLYMEDRIAIKFTSSTGERQLHVASGDFFPSDIAWAMSPGCPYRRHFDKLLMYLLESGIITKWLRDIINDPRRREDVLDEEAAFAKDQNVPLGLSHLQGVFFILTFGLFISCITFGAEMIVCYYNIF